MALRVFDKDGRPLVLDPATRFLMVRRFRNPGGRGTCEVLYDDAGEVLMLDAESISVPELRQAVDHEPGLYRLDQCDEDGNEVGGAPAAYVPIAATRNATSIVATAEPLAIVRDLAQTNADMTKVFADKAAGMMQAVVDCARVVGGVPSKRLLANAALGFKLAPDDGDGDGDDNSDDDDESDERNAATEPPEPVGIPDRMADHAGAALVAAAPVIAKALTDKLMEVLAALWSKGTPPAAAPTSTMTPNAASATEPTRTGVDASGAAAGPGATEPAGTESPPTAATPTTTAPASVGPPAASTSVPLARVAMPSRNVATTTAPTAAVSAPAVGLTGVPTLTEAQLGHFMAIHAALTPTEQALVRGMLHKLNERADDSTRMQLMGELMAMSVEQGVGYVRSLIGQALGKPGAEKEPTS
jgi:hypothetical protein